MSPTLRDIIIRANSSEIPEKEKEKEKVAPTGRIRNLVRLFTGKKSSTVVDPKSFSHHEVIKEKNESIKYENNFPEVIDEGKKRKIGKKLYDQYIPTDDPIILATNPSLEEEITKNLEKENTAKPHSNGFFSNLFSQRTAPDDPKSISSPSVLIESRTRTKPKPEPELTSPLVGYDSVYYAGEPNQFSKPEGFPDRKDTNKATKKEDLNKIDKIFKLTKDSIPLIKQDGKDTDDGLDKSKQLQKEIGEVLFGETKLSEKCKQNIEDFINEIIDKTNLEDENELKEKISQLIETINSQELSEEIYNSEESEQIPIKEEVANPRTLSNPSQSPLPNPSLKSKLKTKLFLESDEEVQNLENELQELSNSNKNRYSEIKKEEIESNSIRSTLGEISSVSSRGSSFSSSPLRRHKSNEHPLSPTGNNLEKEEARLAADRAQRLEAERLEADRAQRLEAERLEAERLEAERLEAERLEAERLKAERLEAKRITEEVKLLTKTRAEEKEKNEKKYRKIRDDAERAKEQEEAKKLLETIGSQVEKIKTNSEVLGNQAKRLEDLAQYKGNEVFESSANRAKYRAQRSEMEYGELKKTIESIKKESEDRAKKLKEKSEELKRDAENIKGEDLEKAKKLREQAENLSKKNGIPLREVKTLVQQLDESISRQKKLIDEQEKIIFQKVLQDNKRVLDGKKTVIKKEAERLEAERQAAILAEEEVRRAEEEARLAQEVARIEEERLERQREAEAARRAEEEARLAAERLEAERQAAILAEEEVRRAEEEARLAAERLEAERQAAILAEEEVRRAEEEARLAAEEEAERAPEEEIVPEPTRQRSKLPPPYLNISTVLRATLFLSWLQVVARNTQLSSSLPRASALQISTNWNASNSIMPPPFTKPSQTTFSNYEFLSSSNTSHDVSLANTTSQYKTNYFSLYNIFTALSFGPQYQNQSTFNSLISSPIGFGANESDAENLYQKNFIKQNLLEHLNQLKSLQKSLQNQINETSKSDVKKLVLENFKETLADQSLSEEEKQKRRNLFSILIDQNLDASQQKINENWQTNKAEYLPDVEGEFEGIVNGIDSYRELQNTSPKFKLSSLNEEQLKQLGDQKQILTQKEQQLKEELAKKLAITKLLSEQTSNFYEQNIQGFEDLFLQFLNFLANKIAELESQTENLVLINPQQKLAGEIKDKYSNLDEEVITGIIASLSISNEEKKNIESAINTDGFTSVKEKEKFVNIIDNFVRSLNNLQNLITTTKHNSKIKELKQNFDSKLDHLIEKQKQSEFAKKEAELLKEKFLKLEEDAETKKSELSKKAEEILKKIGDLTDSLKSPSSSEIAQRVLDNILEGNKGLDKNWVKKIVEEVSKKIEISEQERQNFAKKYQPESVEQKTEINQIFISDSLTDEQKLLQTDEQNEQLEKLKQSLILKVDDLTNRKIEFYVASLKADLLSKKVLETLKEKVVQKFEQTKVKISAQVQESREALEKLENQKTNLEQEVLNSLKRDFPSLKEDVLKSFLQQGVASLENDNVYKKTVAYLEQERNEELNKIKVAELLYKSYLTDAELNLLDASKIDELKELEGSYKKQQSELITQEFSSRLDKYTYKTVAETSASIASSEIKKADQIVVSISNSISNRIIAIEAEIRTIQEVDFEVIKEEIFKKIEEDRSFSNLSQDVKKAFIAKQIEALKNKLIEQDKKIKAAHEIDKTLSGEVEAKLQGLSEQQISLRKDGFKALKENLENLKTLESELSDKKLKRKLFDNRIKALETSVKETLNSYSSFIEDSKQKINAKLNEFESAILQTPAKKTYKELEKEVLTRIKFPEGLAEDKKDSFKEYLKGIIQAGFDEERTRELETSKKKDLQDEHSAKIQENTNFIEALLASNKDLSEIAVNWKELLDSKSEELHQSKITSAKDNQIIESLIAKVEAEIEAVIESNRELVAAAAARNADLMNKISSFEKKEGSQETNFLESLKTQFPDRSEENPIAVTENQHLPPPPSGSESNYTGIINNEPTNSLTNSVPSNQNFNISTALKMGIGFGAAILTRNSFFGTQNQSLHTLSTNWNASNSTGNPLTVFNNPISSRLPSLPSFSNSLKNPFVSPNRTENFSQIRNLSNGYDILSSIINPPKSEEYNSIVGQTFEFQPNGNSKIEAATPVKTAAEETAVSSTENSATAEDIRITCLQEQERKEAEQNNFPLNLEEAPPEKEKINLDSLPPTSTSLQPKATGVEEEKTAGKEIPKISPNLVAIGGAAVFGAIGSFIASSSSNSNNKESKETELKDVIGISSSNSNNKESKETELKDVFQTINKNTADRKNRKNVTINGIEYLESSEWFNSQKLMRALLKVKNLQSNKIDKFIDELNKVNKGAFGDKFITDDFKKLGLNIGDISILDNLDGIKRGFDYKEELKNERNNLKAILAYLKTKNGEGTKNGEELFKNFVADENDKELDSNRVRAITEIDCKIKEEDNPGKSPGPVEISQLSFKQKSKAIT